MPACLPVWLNLTLVLCSRWEIRWSSSIYLFIYPPCELAVLLMTGNPTRKQKQNTTSKKKTHRVKTSLELYKRCGRFAIKWKLFHSPIGEKSAQRVLTLRLLSSCRFNGIRIQRHVLIFIREIHWWTNFWHFGDSTVVLCVRCILIKGERRIFRVELHFIHTSRTSLTTNLIRVALLHTDDYLGVLLRRILMKYKERHSRNRVWARSIAI